MREEFSVKWKCRKQQIASNCADDRPDYLHKNKLAGVRCVITGVCVRALVRRAANCFFPLNFLEPSAIDKAGEEEIPVTCSRDRPLKETLARSLVCDKKITEESISPTREDRASQYLKSELLSPNSSAAVVYMK